jgi:hypothetical protein
MSASQILERRSAGARCQNDNTVGKDAVIAKIKQFLPNPVLLGFGRDILLWTACLRSTGC